LHSADKFACFFAEVYHGMDGLENLVMQFKTKGSVC
jgi:hypothetical protein